MTNKRNQKDQLAKLMATENITIVHKPIPTAYFDVKNRILACPTFKDDISDELYDLFMGHEVGHALNTPYEGLHAAMTKNKTLKGYLNVVEDVRIEKAIKNKFQGLRKSFYTAYNELMEKDFFGVAKRDLSTLSVIDKINLITKCGSRVNIPLNKQEQIFLDMAEACMSWDEVVVCAEAIYEWSKENETRTDDDERLVPQMFDLGDDEEDEDQEGEEGQGGDEEYDDETSDSEDDDGEDDDGEDSDSLPKAPEYGDGDQDEDGEEDDVEESDSEKKTTGTISKEGGVGRPEDYDDAEGARESITEYNAHNNEDTFLDDKPAWREQINLRERFKANDMDIVIGHDQMLADWKEYWKKLNNENMDGYNKAYPKAVFTAKRIQDRNKKLVAHMAKEFEMRQTAMRSVKAFSGKTGKLDMNKLAKYQIVDDVFKRVTMIPDGKNHGVNVLLDWSGSIGNSCAELIEQTIVLAEFCRKANIPHRMYLFSDSYSVKDEYEWGNNDEGFLIEVFSNEMNSKKYKEQLINVATLWMNHFQGKFGWRNSNKVTEIHNAFYDSPEFLIDPEQQHYIYFDTNIRPMNYRLGGTPLDHCLIAMRKLLPEFNKAYNIEKSILTVITDGFSHQSSFLNVCSDEKNAWAKEQGIEYSWDVSECVEILDPYDNKVFPLKETKRGYSRHDNAFKRTQNILSWLGKTCNVVVTGYFVLDKKRDMHDIMGYTSLKDTWWDNDRQLWGEIRKNGLVVDCHGYNKMFLTATSSLGVDGSDELQDDLVDAKKSKVMAAFKRNQKAKTTSRFLTNEFIKEIS
jgi:hypothetical protein|tara:strand:+ start:227 stop:2623 length:2397 start_codon:yes stop_codon:yes gene_type:complete